MVNMWSRDTILKLIALYREHRVLYEVRNPDYHDRPKRNQALEEIRCAICEDRPQTTVAELKAKISNLRIQYLAEKARSRNKHSGMGRDEVETSSCWCFEELSFLNEHIIQRKGTSNIVLPGISEGGTYAENDSQDVHVELTLNSQGTPNFNFVDSFNEPLTQTDLDYTSDSPVAVNDNDLLRADSSSNSVVTSNSSSRKNSLNASPSTPNTSTRNLNFNKVTPSTSQYASPNTNNNRKGKKRQAESSEEQFFSTVSQILAPDNQADGLDSWGRYLTSLIRQIRDAKTRRHVAQKITDFVNQPIDMQDEEQ